MRTVSLLFIIFKYVQESARQNLCYCERALAVRQGKNNYRSFSLRMNNYAPQMIVPYSNKSRALAMARSRYADFYRADSWPGLFIKWRAYRPVHWQHPFPVQQSKLCQCPVLAVSSAGLHHTLF